MKLLLSLLFFLSFVSICYSHPYVVINDLEPSDVWGLTQTSINGQNCYSGYVKVNSTSNGFMFFLFFESQDGNKDAPVALWLQGGPGCSGLGGMILENGPVLIKQDSTLYNNPYGWNKQMHLLYVDNPVGAGYSYVEKENGYPTDEVWMANELYTALSVFFSKYQKYSTNDFYIFGESYAGKYIPAISYKIYEEGNKINLKGFSIGDGLTDPLSQIPHFSDYAYATGLIDINQKAQIVEIENKALAAIKNKEYTKGQDLFYQAVNTIVGWAGGVNEYDIRDYQGYDFGVATEYFNSTAAKKNFGANVDWNFCSDPAQDALLADFSKTVKPLVDVLVQQGYKVLLYNGQFDLIVNLLGAEDWIKNINWAGKTNFNNADRKIWKVDDNVAGYVKNYENLTYIMLLASGHLAPMNQPKNTYDMISRFVNDKPFAN